MKILFLGLGSIGQRHARLLIKGGGHELFALRTNRSDAPQPDFPIQVLSTWEQVDTIKPQLAFVTNPTSMHISTAIECAKRGMDLFMEKPIDAHDEGLDQLLDLIKEKHLTSYVAYCLRFHPVIQYLKEALHKEQACHLQIEAASFLPTWRPGRDYKKIYSSRKELGGGVVFDLSHEIDYVDFLLGPIIQIEGHCARLGDVTVDAEDCADMHISAAHGFANAHLSFLSHISKRRITVYQASQSIVADLINNTVLVYKNNTIVETLSLGIERDVLYQRQLDFFLANIDNPEMMNNLQEAAGLFRKICQFKEKSNAA